jgi:hypothetical protein
MTLRDKGVHNIKRACRAAWLIPSGGADGSDHTDLFVDHQ